LITILKARESILKRYPIQTYPSGLATSVLGLHFKLVSDHFSENGDLRVRCRAALSLWQGNKESIVTKMDTREAQLLGKCQKITKLFVYIPGVSV